MKRAKDALILVILLAIAARVIWWNLEPLVPVLIIGLGLLLIIGTIVRKQRMW